jgi:hypothetical protein
MGVIFAPRSKLGKRHQKPDILIMDPIGQGNGMEEHGSYRALLKHYAPFFRNQGTAHRFRRFAERLEELSTAEQEVFADYLKSGDAMLRKNDPWRVGFRYGRFEFKGTAWESASWPAQLTGFAVQDQNGAFYWGIWTEVIEALREGRLQELLEMAVTEGMTRYDGKVFMLLNDGTAFAYAPSPTLLSPGMFDAYTQTPNMATAPLRVPVA